jgi:dihydrofolate reductase
MVVAADLNDLIGYKNDMPWKKINEDMKFFRKLTENSTVIMGNNTKKSIPNGHLPNR